MSRNVGFGGRVDGGPRASAQEKEADSALAVFCGGLTKRQVGISLKGSHQREGWRAVVSGTQLWLSDVGAVCRLYAGAGVVVHRIS